MGKIENFEAYNPVKLHFGRGVTDKLGASVKNYGNKALLVYGKGSVKRYGYYDIVVEQLKKAGIDIIEFSGIKPNPVIEDVRKAVIKGKENNVDVIVALGGGSVIDSSKIIAASLATGIEPWEMMTWQKHPDKSLPLFCVLTLAATGTEMNAAAVVQNNETGQKNGYVNPVLFPKESFLDPSFTLTVPADYTAYGIVDLIAHALENYFGKGEPSVIDAITFEIIKNAVNSGEKLMSDLTNYDLRAEIMLDATLALNGLTQYGKAGGDWGVHAVGHEISLLFDTPHGATLSIVYTAWLKLHKNKIPVRIGKLTNAVFGTTDIDEGIKKLEEFFTSIGSPVRLSDISLENETEKILEQLRKNKVTGMNHRLNDEDYKTLLKFMK